MSELDDPERREPPVERDERWAQPEARDEQDGWLDGAEDPPAAESDSSPVDPKRSSTDGEPELEPADTGPGQEANRAEEQDMESLDTRELSDSPEPDSSDAQLRENLEFFEREGQRLRESGDLEAATAHAESAQRVRELLGGEEAERTDAVGDGWVDGESDESGEAESEAMRRMDAEQTRVLAENQEFFEREAVRTRELGDLDAAAAHDEAAQRIQELFVADLPADVRARIDQSDLDAMRGPLEYESVADETRVHVSFSELDGSLKWSTTMEEASRLGVMDSVPAIKDALMTAGLEGRPVDVEMCGAADAYLRESEHDLDSPDMQQHLALKPEYSGSGSEPFRPREVANVWEVRRGEAAEYVRSRVAPQLSEIDAGPDGPRRLPGGAVQYYRLGPKPEGVRRWAVGEIRELGAAGRASDRISWSVPGNHRLRRPRN